jgi:AbrB family looped-hinge helix DNA binding protein
MEKRPMARNKKLKDYCAEFGGASTCGIQSLVSVDERGQMVLPKDIREKLKIGAGGKLALILWEKANEFTCVVLIKAEELGDMVRDLLGPMMTDLSNR